MEEYVIKIDKKGNKITVQDVHKVLLSMILDIDKICKKNEIPYFLVAGSALGAHRHQGFIPWDDDFDIGMCYEDYIRFIEVLKKELPEGYVFQCFDTHKEYNVTIPTMKIRKKGTYIKEKNMLLDNKCKDGDGIFIDVFVYDFVSKYRWIDFLNRIPNYILMPMICFFENLNVNPLFLKKFYINHARRYSRKHKQSGYLGTDLAWTYQSMFRPLVHKKETIFPLKQVPFETTTLPIPNDIDAFLTVEIAPDYMTPPPKNKRAPKHILDVNLKSDKPE